MNSAEAHMNMMSGIHKNCHEIKKMLNVTVTNKATANQKAKGQALERLSA